MDGARDGSGSSEGGASSAAPSAPTVKLTGRLRMPKAIPAHLQQHHNQQQQQKLEAQAQYKSDATRDPSFSSQQHDSGGADASMMAMMTSGRSSGGTATQQQQWHRDEHNRFIQALETYGREQSGDEWTKIAGFVQTRSIDEVRQHGRQYLQQLVQELSTTGRALQSIGSLEFAITPSAAGADGSENKDQHDSQNDPNGPNYQVLLSAGATGKPLKSARSRVKSAGGGSRFNSQSSKNLQQQQQNLTGVLAPSALKTPQQGAPAARKSGGRKPKIWTFEEDKIFENALANWSSDKPYSWPKIATALPGKTAKDARSRYEKLVGDIAMIETTEELEPQAHGQQRVQAAQVPPRSGGLSSRISPPPPIQVQPAGVSATEEDKGVDAIMLDFPSSNRSSSSSSRGANRASGSSMLSPTFLDFLTSEEKQPAGSAAAGAEAGAHDLSLSSSLLPSPEYSRRPPSSSAASSAYPRGGRSASPGGLFSSQSRNYSSLSSAAPQTARGGRLTPKGFVTPRIWQEFLSDDFKFDVKALSPSAGEHTAFSGGGGTGAGNSTISQDMSNVTLLASSPERRRATRDQVDDHQEDNALQMECDEPMFDAAMQDDDDEEEDKPQHQQFDRRMADAIRKRPRAWDSFPEEEDGDVEMKMPAAEVDTPRSRSRYSREDRGGRREAQ
ncbi:Chaperone [Globisporangium polare]